MQTDRKYTDQDIYQDRRLKRIAVEYLEDYDGDFDYLLACRDLVISGQRLNVSLTRAVLNCMRQDPRAQHLLPEPRPPQRRKPVLKLVEPRLAVINVKVRWKKQYVLSTWRQAWLAHLIDTERSKLRYITSSNEFKFFVETLCGSRLSSRHAVMDDNPRGRQICTGCQNNRRWY